MDGRNFKEYFPDDPDEKEFKGYSSDELVYRHLLAMSQLSVNSAQPEDRTTVKTDFEDVDRARQAAHESRPRVIRVEGVPDEKINICVLGCQGNKESGLPKQVAKLINETIERSPELKPTLFIILGDNFYPDGVSSPDDPRFEQFHGTYGDPALKHICNIPCIVILGNHDGGRDLETYYKSYVPCMTNPVKYAEAEEQQIAHSLMPHESDPVVLSKPDFFKQESVKYEQLPKHLMPHFYHSWIVGDLQIFALNSNTYVKDYLNLLRHEILGEPIDLKSNQAYWTKQTYEEAKNCKRTTMFNMHHPLVSIGKREYTNGWDANQYLNPLEITILDAILKLSPDDPAFKEKIKKIFEEKSSYSYFSLTNNTNYNEMLRKIIYNFQKMSPDMACAAHDHSNYYYNNKCDNTNDKPKICEVVAGGGGSKDLQHRAFYGDRQSVGGFLRQHGFSIISCDKIKPEYFEINTFTTHGRHLKFTSHDSLPLRQCQPECDEKTSNLRQIILTACDKYQGFIHKMQTEQGGDFFKKLPPVYKNMYNPGRLFSAVVNHHYVKEHTRADMDTIHDMINYFNNYIPASFNDSITFLHTCMNNLNNKEFENSLYMDINEQLQKTFNGSIDELFKEITKVTPQVSMAM